MNIMLLGKAGVGKTTAAEYLVNIHGYQHLALADKIKRIAESLFPEAFDSGRKPRALLQTLGQKMREIDQNVWVHYLMRYINLQAKHFNYYPPTVISDVRYRNEYDAFLAHSFVPVRIVCEPELIRLRLERRGDRMTTEEMIHPSETELDNVYVPFTVDNSGTRQHLYAQLDEIVATLRQERGDPECGFLST